MYRRQTEKHILGPAWSNSSTSVDLPLPFLLAGSLLTFNLSLRRTTALNPQTTVLYIALTFCLSKAFESILNKKILKYLSDHNLLSDHQYGFRKGRSTGDLAFLTESWSSSLRDFGESFAVSLDISKAFDGIWHKSLISKLPFYGFYPSLSTFILSFLSDRSIATVVDGRCSSSKPINSGVPQGTVLSLTLFLLFINDLLNLTQCPIHYYALFNVFQKTTISTRIKRIKERCHRAPNSWPFCNLWLEQN